MVQNLNLNVTINTGAIKKPIAYVPIGDDDFGAANYYESNGIPVRTITQNGTKHLFALIEVDTQAEADILNRNFNRMRMQEHRQLQRRMYKEVSYEKLVEDGYDSAAEYSDPLDIVADLEVIAALAEELEQLTEEKKKICNMVKDEMTERAIAAELDIPQTTLHGRKVAVLKELATKLKDFE